MCLAVPGKILTIEEEDSVFRTGRVSFSGVLKQVSLAYVPEARKGDYVLVHAGFAISVIDQQAAGRTFQYLDTMAEQGERGDETG